MKLLRTHKQGTTTWFVYSCLFQYIALTKLYMHRGCSQLTLNNWIKVGELVQIGKPI